MSTTVEHACGHSVEHEQNYSEWFTGQLEQRPCAGCFRAQYSADVAAARAASAGLPLLSGTEKQVAWATKIRADMIAQHPHIRELARRYAGDARFWIDRREIPEKAVMNLAAAALKNDDEQTLVHASAASLRALLIERPTGTRRVDQEHRSLASAVLRIAGHPPYAWRIIVMIGANPQLFVELATADGDDVAPGLLATHRASVLRQIDDECVRCDQFMQRERDQLTAAAERAAAEKQADAERAARAAARDAEIARQRAPFLAALAPFPWDGSDRYWSHRIRDLVIAQGWPEIEAHPRAIEALRVLAALPDRTALKAIERVHCTKIFDTVLDAQQLAAIVGASGARAMHVAAGLPKPTIRKAKPTHG